MLRVQYFRHEYDTNETREIRVVDNTSYSTRTLYEVQVLPYQVPGSTVLVHEYLRTSTRGKGQSSSDLERSPDQTIKRYSSMPRQDDRSNWSTIRQWTLLRGYSAYRERKAVPPGTLVLLTHQRGDLALPLCELTPALSRLLDGSSDMPPLVLVVDISLLAPSSSAMEKMLDRECSTLETKKFVYML